jgi:hypothetical protein
VTPERLSPLGNVAMGRHLLERSRREPDRASALHQRAVAHSLAAVWVRPQQARALLTVLQAPEAAASEPDDRSCAEDWGPWAIAECSSSER